MTTKTSGATASALAPVQPQTLTIARAKQAWGRLKEAAHDQRNWWLEVGAGLAVGRKLHPSHQAFGKWCKDTGFGDMHRNDRAAAMWMVDALQQNDATALPAGLSHPRLIQQWFNAQPRADEAPPWDLEEAPVPQPPILAQRDAERIVKTIQRAASGGEGADIAAKHVQGLAKKHGITVEQMTESAKVAAPDMFFRFGPQTQVYITDWRAAVLQDVQDLQDLDVPAVAIKALLMNIANSL